ncbi:MAG: hypothetical protein M1828_000454 [Chrysothrix sp. TS-e1954]|nr:MAG: hypothetical protein M1828_000454 [Chrysothrix sp. TS-e1954]
MHVETRATRSRRTKFLQNGIKLFGGDRFLKLGSKQPYGSPELTPPEAVYETCVVQLRHLGDVQIHVYDINLRSKTVSENFIAAQLADLRLSDSVAHNASPHMNDALRQVQSHELHNVRSQDFAQTRVGKQKRKHIYYFCGGAFQAVPSPDHWKLCAYLCTEMNRRGHPTTVSIVSYPLAPNTPATTSLDMCTRLYYEILPSTRPSSPDSTGLSPESHELAHGLSRVSTKYSIPDEEIILAGDSSGGNVVLSTLQHVLSTDASARAPSQLLLISPAVDLRKASPEKAKMDQHAPIVSLAASESAASTWLKSCNGSPHDPRFSPLLGDLRSIADAETRVHCIIAGHDVLAPEAQALKQRCVEEDVAGCWLEWEGMMHDFPLAFAYAGGKAMPEAQEALVWVLDVLTGKKAH